MHVCVISFSLLVFTLTSVRALPYREYKDPWLQDNYADTEEEKWIRDPESVKVDENSFKEEFLEFFSKQDVTAENDDDVMSYADDAEADWQYYQGGETEKESDIGQDGQDGNVEEPTPSVPGDSPDEIMIQFFNSPGDPHTQEIDWNDRDFLKEEYEQGLVQDNWNSLADDFQEALDNERVYQQQNDEIIQAHDMAIDDRDRFTYQEQESQMAEYPITDTSDNTHDMLTQDETSYPYFQGGPMSLPAFDEGYETWGYSQEGDTEELWNGAKDGMESLNMQGNDEGERQRITREVSTAHDQMKALNTKLQELEERQEREGNVTECKTKLCSPCEVKQICVERNEEGECISEEPQTKECCTMGYDQRCKVLKEEKRDEIGKEIEKVTGQLEAIEDKLERLSYSLAEIDKTALNPTE